MADSELAKKLEKRNKINEGELDPAIKEENGIRAVKQDSQPDGPKDKQLSKILDKRNKINEGQAKPGMNTDSGSPVTEAASAEAELAKVLEKRAKINEGELAPTMNSSGKSIYSENPNLSRRCILDLQAKFTAVAEPKGLQSLGVEDLKTVFESLGCPQTHVTLKNLIRDAAAEEGVEVGKNNGGLSFRQFLAVFRKACSDEIDESSPLKQLASLNEIDVGEKGVSGAKEFFQAKMKASGDSEFAREIEDEKTRKTIEVEEARQKHEAFSAMRSKFTAA